MTGQGEGGDLWVRRRAEKDRKRRQKLRKRLEAEGCSEALIERIIAQERHKDLVARHGEYDARAALRKNARRHPADAGYEPSVGDPLLRGSARATGVTAKVVRRKSTITKYQYDRIRGDTALRKEKS